MLSATKEEAKEAILKLKDGECWVWPESDYGRAEFWLKNGYYFLFSIPQYGGKPMFEHAICEKSVDTAIRMVNDWT